MGYKNYTAISELLLIKIDTKVTCLKTFKWSKIMKITLFYVFLIPRFNERECMCKIPALRILIQPSIYPSIVLVTQAWARSSRCSSLRFSYQLHVPGKSPKVGAQGASWLSAQTKAPHLIMIWKRVRRSALSIWGEVTTIFDITCSLKLKMNCSDLIKVCQQLLWNTTAYVRKVL